MWVGLVRRWSKLLATLGNIVGLRSTESDVTLTVEGRWSGKFDPVRLGLVSLIVGMALLMGVCAACNWDTGDPLREGPYQIATPQGPR